MFHLTFIPDENETFKVSVKRIASGFKNPIDAVIVENKILRGNGIQWGVDK